MIAIGKQALGADGFGANSLLGESNALGIMN